MQRRTISTAGDGISTPFLMEIPQAISGATGDEFDDLREKAREMGAKTKFSASEAGAAFEYMAMAGWKTGDMLDGIEGIMSLAAASGEDLATTSDIVTDALTAFGLSAKDSGHFADILASASSNANTNVSMMGETFKYAAPIAGALGYTAEDTALAIMNASEADVNKLATAIDNCDGSAEQMAATMQDNLNGQITILKSALDPDVKKRALAGEVDIKFNCKTQLFLKSGEIEQTVMDGGYIYNPTPYTAAPTLRFKFPDSEEGGSITINGVTISIQKPGSGEDFIIDCERQDIYLRGGRVNKNNDFVLSNGEFFELKPGRNLVQCTGLYLNRVWITPNWWTV